MDNGENAFRQMPAPEEGDIFRDVSDISREMDERLAKEQRAQRAPQWDPSAPGNYRYSYRYTGSRQSARQKEDTSAPYPDYLKLEFDTRDPDLNNDYLNDDRPVYPGYGEEPRYNVRWEPAQKEPTTFEKIVKVLGFLFTGAISAFLLLLFMTFLGEFSSLFFLAGALLTTPLKFIKEKRLEKIFE